MTARWGIALVVLGVTPLPAAGQSLRARVAAASDGVVRFSFAARPGVMGNGRDVISWDCDGGRCNSNRVTDQDGPDDGRGACASGPVRVALRVRGGRASSLRVSVGGAWPPGAATDLGAVAAAEAARFLLTLDLKNAVFAATLADSVTVWPELLRIARTPALRQETRRDAVFWLGQAAGAAATRGLDELVDGEDVDQEVREAAVFALSQRPREEGVPALIRVARAHRDPEIRRQAIFWLGQSQDPRALALFEELLTRP